MFSVVPGINDSDVSTSEDSDCESEHAESEDKLSSTAEVCDHDRNLGQTSTTSEELSAIAKCTEDEDEVCKEHLEVRIYLIRSFCHSLLEKT